MVCSISEIKHTLNVALDAGHSEATNKGHIRPGWNLTGGGEGDSLPSSRRRAGWRLVSVVLGPATVVMSAVMVSVTWFSLALDVLGRVAAVWLFARAACAVHGQGWKSSEWERWVACWARHNEH